MGRRKKMRDVDPNKDKLAEKPKKDGWKKKKPYSHMRVIINDGTLDASLFIVNFL